MAAGIQYNVTPMATERELYDVKSSYRLSGGFNLDTTGLESGSYVPVLTPLAINFQTRKAVVCRSVKIVEDATNAATKYKIAKGSFAYVDMHLGNGSKGITVSAIDKSNANYDEVTVSATLGVAVTAGTVLFEASAAGGTALKNTPNALNYARTKVEAGATVSALGQAYEIKESELYVPISQAEKTALGHRYLFI